MRFERVERLHGCIKQTIDIRHKTIELSGGVPQGINELESRRIQSKTKNLFL